MKCVCWKSPSVRGNPHESISNHILVGGLEHEFYFSIYWKCQHPNWHTYNIYIYNIHSIFFRGVGWNHQPDHLNRAILMGEFFKTTRSRYQCLAKLWSSELEDRTCWCCRDDFPWRPWQKMSSHPQAKNAGELLTRGKLQNLGVSGSSLAP